MVSDVLFRLSVRRSSFIRVGIVGWFSCTRVCVYVCGYLRD